MQELLDVVSKKKAIIAFFITKNILINTAVLEKLKDEQTVTQLYAAINETKFGQELPLKLPLTIDKGAQEAVLETSTVKICFDYEDKKKKKEMQDFVGLFRARFKTFEKMMQSRQELQNLSSINRLSARREEKISIIGMVFDKQITKNENIILTVEDETGTIKVIISKTKTDLYLLAKDLVLDEVVGVSGSTGDNVIFAQNIIFPDVPLLNEFKKSPEEAYALILSDIHVGSVYFLEEEFKKFIAWVRGESGTEEQRTMSKKVKYIFIVGDLVDGVGIYPSQEKELAIKDVYAQYKEFSKYIQQIPKGIQIIISTGNHDAVRLAEPQPKITKELCPELWVQKNITFVGNPSLVQIHAAQGFPGFDFLLYHGYSYDYYGDVVESIKNSGRHISDRNDIIMKFLLQRRHLAPTYTSTPYIPDRIQDPLIIEKVPDFFLSGHVHKSAVASYRGVQIISGSCWQAKTTFQEKVGHEPEPGRVPIVNLQTRQVKILRFDSPTQDNKQVQK